MNPGRAQDFSAAPEPDRPQAGPDEPARRSRPQAGPSEPACGPSRPQAGLAVIHSNRLEVLAQALAHAETAPADPMAPEVVVVQSKGMQRYVSMVLAHERGICANVLFPFPIALAYDLFCHAFDDVPASPPLNREALAWAVWQVLPEVLAEPGFDPLARYLDRKGPGREFRLAQRIASLLDDYTLFRPEMIRAWDRGEQAPATRGAQQSFARHEPWQAGLWRRVTRGASELGRARLTERYLEHLAQLGPGASPGPFQALNVFGVSSLPPAHLGLLKALAAHIPVRIYFLNPCREYWGDIVSERRQAWRERRGRSMEHAEQGNALLASMGQVGQEFFDALVEEESEERFEDPGRDSLLTCLQQDVLDLAQPGSGEDTGADVARHFVRADDDSLRVHCCHGPMREMEVLRDQMLAMLDQDRDLTPRDFLVMVPDIEFYVPYIKAVFSDPSRSESLPFSLDDRSASAGGAARAFLELLALARGRLEAPKVIAVLECPSVAARFELSGRDLALIRQWLRATGVRWGLDGDHRRALGFPAFGEHSWRSGLERLVLGVAMAPERDRLFSGLMPARGVEREAGVLGRFLDFVDRLVARLRDLAEARPPGEWVALLQALLEEFFSEQGGEAQELAQLSQALKSLAQEAESAACTRRADLADMERALAGKLQAPGFFRGYLARGITFCSLRPMRAIPFAVIWLAGMNDGAFPRRDARPGFDLMAAQRRPLDRNMRADDRYLFLEALLSARRRLHVSYVGRSARDNSATPPSVLVSELLDAVTDSCRLEQGGSDDLRSLICVEHKLQAFHPDYFRAGSGLFSYSEQDCEGARLLAGVAPSERGEDLRVEAAQEAPTAEPLADAALSLEELILFLKNPARTFSRERLGVILGREEEPLGDMEPMGRPDALEAHQLRGRLLDAMAAGRDMDAAYRAVRAENLLPPGLVGRRVFEALALEAGEQAGRVRKAAVGTARLEPVAADLDLGPVRLSSALAGVHEAAQVVATASDAHGATLVDGWIRHLALNAAADMEIEAETGTGGVAPLPRRTVLVCKKNDVRLGPVEDAATLLADLAALRELGMASPLPFFPKSAWEFASNLSQGRDKALTAARNKWRAYVEEASEARDDYFETYFGNEADPLGARFQELALRVFGPLLQAMESGGGKVGGKGGGA